MTTQDNSAQIEFWDGKAGETWTQAQQQMDAMLEPLSNPALEVANAQVDERVIDVGCGCGATSLAMAAAGAQVWGIDLSEMMLERARQRAGNLANVAFSKTDAAAQNYTSDHDLIFSRFGVMFFADPIAAFSNLRTALRDHGRLVFVCWQTPRNNPWLSVPGAAVQPFLPPPDETPDPRAPGPFAFADKDWVSEILTSAGFSDVQISASQATLTVGGGLDEAMNFQTRVGPLARAMAELEDDERTAALAAAREAFQPFLTDTGVCLDAATWIVSAKKISP